MIARLYELAKKKLLGRREPARIYELGREEGQNGGNRSIEYHTNRRSQHFGVGIGFGHDAYGTMISARDLLSPTWQDHLRLCGALWLAPLLERFAAGERVTTEAVLHTYEQQHGRLPPFHEIETP